MFKRTLNPRSRIQFYWRATVVAALLLAALFYRAGQLGLKSEAALKRRIIKELVSDIQSKVPFKIVDVDIHGQLRDVRRLHLESLYLVLKWATPWGVERLVLDGPVDLSFSPLPTLRYQPSFELQGPIQSPHGHADLRATWQEGPAGPQPDLFATLYHLKAARLEQLSLQMDTPSVGFSGPNLKLKTERFSLHSSWDGTTLGVQASSGSMAYEDPKSSAHQFQAKGVGVGLNFPISSAPTKLGASGTLQVSFKSAELLWDQFYFDAPPFQAQSQINGSPDLLHPIQADTKLSLGSSTVTFKARSEQKKITLRWHTDSVPVANLAHLFLPASAEIKSGTLHSDGSVEVSTSLPIKVSHWNGYVDLKDVNAQGTSAPWMIESLKFHFPLSGMERESTASVSVGRWGYMKFQGLLSPTEIRVSHDSLSTVHIEIEKPELMIQNLPLILGGIHGQLSRKNFQWDTSIDLQPIEVGQVLSGACIDPKQIPPAKIQAHWSHVRVTPDLIEPDGQVLVDFFNGKIDLNNLSIEDPFAEVREVDFDLDWRDIRVDQIGDWLGFGKMDATVMGHAHDVTFENWLPTHYDFKIELRPYRHRTIVFSSDAMKNFVKLFAGQELDDIPGLATWLAFGWPSQVFGGYNIDYLGLSLFSSDGSIMVETLDPPEIVDRDKKHYILHGPRFRMPLDTPHYPLITDATAMADFVQHVSRQLDTMSKQKHPKPKETVDDESTTCLPDPPR